MLKPSRDESVLVAPYQEGPHDNIGFLVCIPSGSAGMWVERGRPMLTL